MEIYPLIVILFFYPEHQNKFPHTYLEFPQQLIDKAF